MSGLQRDQEPSQRFATADLIASAVLFLASEASDNSSGVDLALDGGWTTQQAFTARPSFCQ